MIFALWVGLFAGSARAETLEVVVHKPADEALIGHHILAFDFVDTSRWAERWSGNLRSRLIGAELLGEKMFDIPIPARTDIADLVVTGELTLDVQYFDAEPEITRKCTARDDEDNCTSWTQTVRECQGLAIVIDGYVRFNRPGTGEPVTGFSEQDEDTRISCELGGPTLGGSPEYMLDQMVRRASAKLLPAKRREDIRIRESRKGLKGEDRRAFKQAVKLTDDDPDAACAAFEALLESNPENISLLFNTGLCAERLRDYDKAYERYVQALFIAPRTSHPERGIERIERNALVEQQFDRHFGPHEDTDVKRPS